jgi:sec-independent protein translocase protein TatC
MIVSLIRRLFSSIIAKIYISVIKPSVDEYYLKSQTKRSGSIPVVILILSAVITPPDVTSQIILSFPILLLYEIGKVIARRVAPKTPIELPET